VLAELKELAAKRSQIDARVQKISSKLNRLGDGWTENETAAHQLPANDDGGFASKESAEEALAELKKDCHIVSRALAIARTALAKARDAASRDIAADVKERHTDLIQRQIRAAATLADTLRAEKAFLYELDAAGVGFPQPPLDFATMPHADGFLNMLPYWAGELEASDYDVDTKPLVVAIGERSDHAEPTPCCV
jgi:hypothetical protein